MVSSPIQLFSELSFKEDFINSISFDQFLVVTNINKSTVIKN